MKIAVKAVGEPLKIVETQEIYRTDCVREYVGKDQHIEYVKLSGDDTFSLGVNENGLPMELPVNFLLATKNKYFPVQKMVGTAVFVRTKYADVYKEEIWDYEVEDLTPADIKYIERLLSSAVQRDLERKFNDYGKGYSVFVKVEL